MPPRSPFIRRWWPVGIWLVALALSGVQIARTTFTADLSAFLPKAPTPEQQLLVDQLRDGLVSRLVLVAIDGADSAGRAAVSNAMAARLQSDAQFSAVANGAQDATARDQAFLFSNRYQLSARVDADRFTVDGLRRGVQDSLELLASSSGLLVKSLLPRDPTGELVALLDQLGETATQRPASADGVWTSRDGRRAVLLLQTRASGSDTDAQQRAVAAVQAAHRDAVAALPASSAGQPTLQMTGPGVFAVQVRHQIEREVTRLSVLSALIVVALMLAIYRSVPVLLLGLVPVLSGAAAGVVAVSLVFGNVHGLTLGFGSTLIGEAVDYAIYFFVQTGGGTAAARATWAQRFWPTIRLGMLTSVIGFASLLLSGFPGLAQLGLYSVAGLLAAAAVTRFVLPLLVPQRFQARDVVALGHPVRRAIEGLPRLRIFALALLVAAVAVVGWRHDRLWNHELSALSPVSAADQALDASLRADLGAPDVRYLVVVGGPDQESVLQAAERATAALQPLVQSNAIGGVETPTRMLPSQRTQLQRSASIPDASILETRLTQALDGQPIRADRLAPFLADAERARTAPPIARGGLDGTTLAAAVDGMLVQNPAAGAAQRWSALLPLHAPRLGQTGGRANDSQTIDPARVRSVLADAGVAADGTRVLVVDLKGEADTLYGGYLREAVWLSLGGLAAIAALLFAALRSGPAVLRVLAPLAGAVLVAVAGLVLAGERMTILHLVGLLLIVAVGSNYALFFNAPDDGPNPATPDEAARTLASVAIASFTTVAGFGLLAFSTVPVLQALGMTVGPGSVLALVFAAVFARRTAPA